MKYKKDFCSQLYSCFKVLEFANWFKSKKHHIKSKALFCTDLSRNNLENDSLSNTLYTIYIVPTTTNVKAFFDKYTEISKKRLFHFSLSTRKISD